MLGVLRKVAVDFFFGNYSVYNNSIVGALIVLFLHVGLSIENKLALVICYLVYTFSMIFVGRARK